MILTCPNCGTQYVVKDGAIPPAGRQVRCASCKHSWHQDPETTTAPEPVAKVAAEPESVGPEPPDDNESVAEATLIEPRSGPEAEEWAYEETAIEDVAPEPAPDPDRMAAVETPPEAVTTASDAADWRAPPGEEAQDDEFSPFAAPDEIEPRRRSRVLAILLIVVIVAALAAAFWFLAPPEWKARLGIAGSGISPLALVTTHMDRQRLESGNELLTVTGRVINPTSRDQTVPPLQAQLKSSSGQVVYSWTIAPPARTLPPGASASFNSAEVNVPPGGEELTITLGPPRA
ncbi:MAG TPA: MJ0042-type zinc finger domain-containing protein [Sphingomicrobium sp.]